MRGFTWFLSRENLDSCVLGSDVGLFRKISNLADLILLVEGEDVAVAEAAHVQAHCLSSEIHRCVQ